MKKNLNAVCLSGLFCSALLLISSPASAQEGHWWLRTGPAFVDFKNDVTLKAPLLGGEVPGANASVKDNVSVAAEIGYDFTDNWALGLTLGYPPTTELKAGGSLKNLGKLGSITYGPAVLTAQYRFTNFGRFQPYLGAGWSYMLVLDSKDKAVSNLNVDDVNGLTLQAGFEYRNNEDMGLFFDVKRLFLEAEATGNAPPAMGGIPVKGEIVLDPFVYSAGVVFYF
ncbi:OmpW family protein [Pseudomonas sp. CMR5c]|uniref:OmpW/AlkL family protein n=1 Tax=Pseudomonas sp. CMR5c TaxID=658630 RepID=UPI0009F85D41|nr:OmpW family outer membrane protein [Pseudomonas sp. CMR5c]AZC18551.1 OmpW family protein [Pseudomonas sp. CMR5c]